MSRKEFSFELITQNDKARLGKIHTPRGIIDTPAFMPVGTQGTVKGIFTDDIKKTNTHYVLSPYKNHIDYHSYYTENL